MMRCLCCHKESFSKHCSSECQKKCEDFQAHVDKYGIKMLLLFFGSLVFIIPTIIFDEIFYIGVMVAVMGAVVIISPFETDDTVQMLGLRKTVNVIRPLGAGMMLSGVILMLFQSF